MEKDFLPHLKRIIENPHHEQGVLMEQVRKVLLEYDLIDQNDYTSKKISDIPETKQITITIMGTEKGKSRSFGTYRFAVRNTAPKVIVLIIIRCGIRDLISPGLSNCRT